MRLGECSSIEMLLGRLALVPELDSIVLATTSEPDDDVLVERLSHSTWATAISVYRGSAMDVLGRFASAAKAHSAGTVVRVTGDDPFKDPVLVSEVCQAFAASGVDYAATERQTGFPEGMDVEVISAQALERSARLAAALYEREHVTAHVREHLEIYRHLHVAPPNRNFSTHRYTLDTPDDLLFMRHVVKDYPAAVGGVAWTDLCSFVENRPSLKRLMPQIPAYAGLELSRRSEGSGGISE